jgi:hypothetical protein
MSMKVYNAFRLKRSVDLWSFLWALRDTAQANIRSALKTHYVDLVQQMDSDDPSYQEARAKDPERPEWSFRLYRAHNLVINSYKENSTKPNRDTYSLDVTVAVYPHNGRYYLRTFCESVSVVGTVLDFVEQLPELEDYHYQNQSDRPDEVSAREWAQRRDTWNAIVDNNQNIGNHVTLDVFDWTGFHLADPWRDLAKEWQDRPPTLQSREEYWVNEFKSLKSLRNDPITFTPGAAIQGPKFLIIREEDGGWLMTLKNRKPRRYASLNRAADRVSFEFQPESIKRWARQTMKESKEKRRAQKSTSRG